MREITIATVQMKPALGESEDNLVKMSDFVSKIASQQKVDLIVFPELATSGYELGVRFTELAQRIPGPTINLMAQRAAEFGVYIAFGLVTKERVESILYNSAVLVGPDGELLGSYNKIHLRGEERMAFREGFRLPVFETEIGNIGLLLGWDLAFPEVVRSLALEGAELVAVLANWETAQLEEWRTYVRARAFENALFVAAANRVGEDVTLNFGGESMIVGPRGKSYASLAEEKDPESGEPREGYCVARIDLEEVRKCREEFQILQSRQPTVYRTIVRRY
jgi:predicted amidohydrolase